VALLGNYNVLAKSPGRTMSGTTETDRSAYGKSGALRCRYTAWDAKSGMPNGYQHPGAWLLARKDGGISSYTLTLGYGTATGSIAGGKNATATLTGSGDITSATAALIVSAVATLTGSGTVTNAAAVAFLNAAATLAGTGNLTGALTALGNATAALTGVGTVTPTIRASGELTATLTPFTDLSPQSLAAAVWGSVAGAYTDPDTFGGQAAFLYALAHNKTVTDPAAGTFTVYADDGTTVLYVADLWENAAASQRYRGQGADRRDEFD
jgi:hypothetical protein